MEWKFNCVIKNALQRRIKIDGIFKKSCAIALFFVATHSLAFQDMKESNSSSVASPIKESAISQDHAVAVPQTQSVDMTYVLSVNDMLHVLIYQESDLTTITRISQEGNITLPLVGNLKVAGSTIREATEIIQNAYRQKYLRNPRVTLTLIQFAKKRFHVLGEVQRPGSYEMPPQESVNLLQAISMAGGYTSRANSNQIRIKRIENEEEHTLALDAQAMAQNKNTEIFKIQQNDVITIDESPKMQFYILGQVRKPGSYEIPSPGNMSLLQAISMAEGYTEEADATSVLIKRLQDGKEITLECDAHTMAENKTSDFFEVQPNDTITIAKLAKQRFHILGEVQKPGSYEIPSKEAVNLLQAISIAGGFTHLANPTRVIIKRVSDQQEHSMELNAKTMMENKNAPTFTIQANDIITVKERIF
ncbi:MAG: SLBB domain-containing protein [Verrucomicrobiota bacterium]